MNCTIGYMELLSDNIEVMNKAKLVVDHHDMVFGVCYSKEMVLARVLEGLVMERCVVRYHDIRHQTIAITIITIIYKTFIKSANQSLDNVPVFADNIVSLLCIKSYDI